LCRASKNFENNWSKEFKLHTVQLFSSVSYTEIRCRRLIIIRDLRTILPVKQFRKCLAAVSTFPWFVVEYAWPPLRKKGVDIFVAYKLLAGPGRTDENENEGFKRFKPITAIGRGLRTSRIGNYSNTTLFE